VSAALPTSERLRTLAERLAARGLRPRIDAGLGIIVCDCPSCHAQDSDPMGLYRPLQVAPCGETITLSCWACGEEREVRRV